MRNKSILVKGNSIVLLLCFISITFLTVGYSILSQRLNINSAVTLKPDRDIRITNVSNYYPVNGGYEVYNSSYTVDSFSSTIALPNLNSQLSYTLTITNYGEKAMEIQSIIPSVFNNDDILYTLSGACEGTVIEKDNSVELMITYYYNDLMTVLPDNISVGAVFDLVFIEYIPVTSYVSMGNILDLRGYETPTGSSWIDSRNNKSVALTNSIYSADELLYNFSTPGAYGTLGQPIIPQSGDFTIEAYIKTPTDFGTNADMAIISQVSNTSNDSGRFKINIKYDNGNGLITFFHSQDPNTTNFLSFASRISTNTSYLVQVVRTGEEIKLYLNRELIRTESYKSTNTISQGPFKIAYWNSASTQQYTGGVYAVRIYNRALTIAELSQNADMDVYNYYEEESILKTYVLANHLVTSGEGLYNTDTNEYRYKGITVNNYIKFLGNNDLYRIVSFNSDGTIKLLNHNIKDVTAFDAQGNRIYDINTSSYCVQASSVSSDGTLFGCNYFGTTTDYLGKNVPKDSTIKTALNNWYNNLSTSVKKYIVRHDYNGGLISTSASYAQIETQASQIIYNDYVGLIELKDLIDASITPVSVLSTNVSSLNYMVKMSNSADNFWTINGATNNTYDVWAAAFGTQIGVKKSSRTFQKSGDITAYFRLRPSFYISDNLIVKGNGTYDNPFIIIAKNV